MKKPRVIFGSVLGSLIGAQFNGMEGPLASEPAISTLGTLINDDMEEVPGTYLNPFADLVLRLASSVTDTGDIERRNVSLDSLRDLRGKLGFPTWSLSDDLPVDEYANAPDHPAWLLYGAIYGAAYQHRTDILRALYEEMSAMTGEWDIYQATAYTAMVSHVCMKRLYLMGGSTVHERQDITKEATYHAGWLPDATRVSDCSAAVMQQCKRIFQESSSYRWALQRAAKLGGHANARCAILGAWYGALMPHTIAELEALVPGELAEQCNALDDVLVHVKPLPHTSSAACGA